MRKGRILAAIAVNLVLAALCIGAWLWMALRGGGLLSSRGMASLRYFTVLSNLLCGGSALIAAVLQLRGERQGGELPLWAARLKLAATTAVGLTFVVVIAFLGPVFGYGGLYDGPGFFMHLINPVLAWLVLILLENRPDMGRRDAVLTMIPPLTYAVYYFGVVLIKGREGNDFYGFCLWSWPGAVLIVLVLAVVVFGMASLLNRLRRMKAAGEKRQEPKSDYSAKRSHRKA